MGMTDSVYTPLMVCDACGHVSNMVEVQFKVYVGNAYSPQCRTLKVGDVLPGMPPIPKLDEWGCWNCDDCDHLNEARVRLKAGRVVEVSNFSLDAEGNVVPPMAGLPQPRSEKKRVRRAAASEERHRRSMAEIHARAAATRAQGGDTRFATLGIAMAMPLMRMLNYTSVARSIFCVEPVGTQRVGPYRKEPGKSWERYRDVRSSTSP